MKLFFTYRLKDEIVVSYSTGLNKVSENFKQVELDITDEQFALIKSGYRLYYKDKLIFEKTEAMKEDDKKNAREDIKQILMEKKSKLSIEELTDLLIQSL